MSNSLGDTCVVCHATWTSVTACVCNKRLYCGEECKKKDWDGGHDVVCEKKVKSEYECCECRRPEAPFCCPCLQMAFCSPECQ
ncbi:hypothetical protein SARC_14353, partial [Sphaeroforma arctica JP610]